MDYAIIKLGNKQHRVRDGETLVVDRLPAEEGKSFEPVVLLGDTKVTATVLAHGRGPKILIGKYRKRTGYKRHNGFRAAVSRVEITLGAGTAKRDAAKTTPQKAAPPKAKEADPVEATELAAPASAPAAETGPAAETVAAGTAPAGYEDMTVAQVSAAAKGWSVEQLETALSYESANAARKGAIAAIEAALKKEEAGDGA